MEYQWVIGRFEDEQAERVQAYADKGIGYFVQKAEGKGKGRIVTAAFKRAIDGPLPDHLDLATIYQVEKLENMEHRRNSPHVS